MRGEIANNFVSASAATDGGKVWKFSKFRFEISFDFVSRERTLVRAWYLGQPRRARFGDGFESEIREEIDAIGAKL